MKRAIILFLLMGVAVLAGAKEKTHIASGDQECSDCHAGQAQVWLEGKHGLMNVKCVVCHGSPERNFDPKPALSRCRGCHADQVADVEKKMPAKNKSCFFCHDNHRVTLKDAAREKSGFHRQGGAK